VVIDERADHRLHRRGEGAIMPLVGIVALIIVFLIIVAIYFLGLPRR